MYVPFLSCLRHSISYSPGTQSKISEAPSKGMPLDSQSLLLMMLQGRDLNLHLQALFDVSQQLYRRMIIC